MANSLEYCKKCKSKVYDMNKGILCKLTNEKPVYQGMCIHYENNPDAMPERSYYSTYRTVKGQASGGVRFGNLIIDIIILSIIMYLISSILRLIGIGGIVDYGLTSRLYSVFMFVSYYTFFETILKGRTIGKLITGTVTIDEKGNRIGFEKALIRSLCRLIPFEGFSYLGIYASGWHDTLTQTKVVEMSYLKETAC